MTAHVDAELAHFPRALALAEVFARGAGHIVGTSGAITSLAAIHLGLRRYDRAKVDGLWLTPADCAAAADTLRTIGPLRRAAEPCIGPDRADLVLPGAAILRAVQARWPCARVRVADRGLREGLLLDMVAADAAGLRRRGRGRGSRAAMRNGSRGAALPA